MKYSKLKEYITTTPDPELMTDFILLVLWGVTIGSFIALSILLLRLAIG
jgi:hypothetical protein